jgi:GPH family glycoside/pentoside/hexuronide:cation symporter
MHGGIFIAASTCLLAIGPRYITSAEVALLILLESILAPLLVWWVLEEAIGRATLIGGAVLLGTGDWPLFALICLASGAAMGADLTLLPALFAARMAAISPSAAEGFGLWSFVSKFTLAVAALTLLPALERAGFDSGASDNPDSALTTLSFLYAGLPCLLKLIAIALLAKTELKEI